MLFVPFPEWSEGDRRATLLPLEPTALELVDLASAPWPRPLEGSPTLQVERLGPRLVVRTLQGSVYDAATAVEIGPLDFGLLDAVASASMGAPALTARWIEIDQWTVSGRLHRHRPLRRVEFDDGLGTHIYVSSRTGEIVQRTRAWERRWNQAGAVAHWLYWVGLRSQAKVWSMAVIALSALTTCVLLIGLLLGRRRESRRSTARRRHRLLGWTAGTVLILWSASGLLSMNPFGLLASASQPWHAAFPLGAPPSCTGSPTSLRPALLTALRLPEAQRARFVRLGSLAGTPAIWIEGASPPRRDLNGRPAAHDPDAVSRAAIACAGPPIRAFGPVAADDPYLSTDAGPRLRAHLDDPAATWIEFDAQSGEVTRRLDRNGRLERWLHRGLHTLDVLGPLRRGVLGEPLVLALLVGACVLVASGITIRRRNAPGRRP